MKELPVDKKDPISNGTPEKELCNVLSPHGTEDRVTVESVKFEWKHIKIDDVWHFLRRFGRYQVIHLILMFVQLLNLALPILSSMFTGKAIDFQCVSKDVRDLSNESIVATSCSVQVVDNVTSQIVEDFACTQYDYGRGDTKISFLAQWDLVCGRETLGQLPQIFTMVGMALGALLLPQLGDRFGRKKLAVGAYLCLATASLGASFVQHFELLTFLHFVMGASQQGAIIPLFTMQIELMPMEMASFISMVTSVAWVGSMCMVGAVGYCFRDFSWRTMQLAYGVIQLPGLLSLCFLDESVRWLLGNSKIKEADAIFRKACKMNKKNYNKLMETVLSKKEDEAAILSPGVQQSHLGETCEDSKKKTDDARVILFSKNMRKIAGVMCYTWMIAAMTYYGLTLLSTSLAGDPYVNYFLGCIVELPSGPFIYYSMQKLGRKRTLILCNFVSGAALLCAVLVVSLAPSSGAFIVLQTCFTMIGKFFISCSFNIVWIYTPELYPTNIRNVGIGISSTTGRFGAIFSPLFTLLARVALWAPGVLFSVGCFISVYLLTLIPETRWRELPQNVQEIDHWFEKDKKEHNKEKANVI